jgi:hypothetical protein
LFAQVLCFVVLILKSILSDVHPASQYRNIAVLLCAVVNGNIAALLCAVVNGNITLSQHHDMTLSQHDFTCNFSSFAAFFSALTFALSLVVDKVPEAALLVDVAQPSAR